MQTFMQQEIWKDVVGYEKYYMISSMGKIKHTGYVAGNIKNQYSGERYLCQTKDAHGYMYVKLWFKSKSKHSTIHRLVSKAFIENPFNKPYVNHKDGNKQNNNVDNLEWCTPKENAVHAWNMGLYKDPPTYWKGKTGEAHIRSIKVLQYSKDGQFIKEWASATEAERVGGHSRATIKDQLKGKSKRAIVYQWKYKYPTRQGEQQGLFQ